MKNKTVVPPSKSQQGTHSAKIVKGKNTSSIPARKTTDLRTVNKN